MLAIVAGYPAAVRVWNQTGWASPCCYPEKRGTHRVWGQVGTRPPFHFTIPTTLPPINYLNSDYIATWSIHEMCRLMLYFISHSQICDRLNVHRVTEIKLKITPKWPGFHRYSTTIGPIANRRMWDKRGHQTAYFTYRLCHDTMRTPILNWSKICWLLTSGFCLETSWNGPVPGRNRTRNWTRNLDPLLTLSMVMADFVNSHC